MIREYSGFMLLVLVLCWLELMFITPLTILVHHFHFSVRRRNLQKQRELIFRVTKRERPQAQVLLHNAIADVYKANEVPLYDEMIKTAQANIITEVKERTAGKSLNWRFNLKPHFAKLTGGHSAVPENQPKEGTNGDTSAATAAEDEANTTGFEHVEDCGYVVENDLSPDMRTIVRVKGMCCENIHDRDTERFQDAVQDMGTIDTAPVICAKSFAKVAGITAVGARATKRLVLIARLAALYLQSYGWAAQIPMPHMAEEVSKAAAVPHTKTESWLDRHKGWVQYSMLCYFCRTRETKEEREERLRRLATKNEKFNRLERVLAGPWCKTLRKLKWGVVAFLCVCLVVSIGLSTQVRSTNKVPDLLPSPNPLAAYNDALSAFTSTTTCDYCSAFFSVDQQRVFNVKAVSKCATKDSANLMANLSICGTCDPNDVSCLSCDGKKYSNVRLDTCGQCMSPQNPFFNKCDEKRSSCICMNGGQCNKDGVCECPPGWTGTYCSVCNDCGYAKENNTRGFCPTPYSQENYEFFKCRDIYCTEEEIEEGVETTSACLLCRANRVTTGCDLKNKTCDMATYIPPDNGTTHHCQCRGAFTGAGCMECNLVNTKAVNCSETGALIGCDGVPANKDGEYTVEDVCGECGGNNECVGCDGVFSPGGIVPRVDRCGVCGGDNNCKVFTPVFVLQYLNLMNATVADVYNLSQTMSALVPEALTPVPEGNILAEFFISYSSVLDVSGRGQKPFSDFMSLLRTYVTFRSLTDRVHFFPRRDRPNSFGVDYIVYEYRTVGFNRDSSQRDIRKMFYHIRQVLLFDIPFVRYQYMASEIWVSLSLRRALAWDTASIVGISVLGSLSLLAVYVCSYRVVLAASVVVVLTVLWCTSTIFILGLQLGPVELITMLFVLSMSISCVIYMSEGYVEHLDTTQAQLLALPTTRKENVKGMLRRTGAPVLVACLTLVLSSLLLLGTSVSAFRTAGGLMAIMMFLTCLFCLSGFPVLLVVFGPTKSNRRPFFMMVYAVTGLFATVVIAATIYVARN